jgi:hypothetical protein
MRWAALLLAAGVALGAAGPCGALAADEPAEPVRRERCGCPRCGAITGEKYCPKCKKRLWARR